MKRKLSDQADPDHDIFDIPSSSMPKGSPRIPGYNFYHPPTHRDAKPILCRLYYFTLYDDKELIEPVDTASIVTEKCPFQPEFLLAFQAISQLDNPVWDALMMSLAHSRPVLCFEHQGSQEEIAATFVSLLKTYPSIGVFGGRDEGAEAAIGVARTSQVKQLILIGVRFVKTAPFEEARIRRHDNDLPKLGKDVKIAFINGEDDTTCLLRDFHIAKRDMVAKSCGFRVECADHDLIFREIFVDGAKTICEALGRIVAAWLAGDKALCKSILDEEDVGGLMYHV